MIDAHYHLDERAANLRKAWGILLEQMERNKLNGVQIYHLRNSKFDLNEIRKLVSASSNIFLNEHIDPTSDDSLELLIEARNSGSIGIKLHPRIDRYPLSDARVERIVEHASFFGLPISICSFWDGLWNQYGLTIESYGDLADKFPNAKFNWCHFGGIKVLEFMMMLRRRSNVYADISLTQHYFFGGSIREDLIYSIESLKGKRILFGSDYPNSNFSTICESWSSIMSRIDIANRADIQRKIDFENAIELYPSFQNTK